ncbi:MAG: xanthine phosphoribosyltransferase [Flexilinea sp.]
MKLLEERIKKDGHVKGANILKVDSFLNHQIDVFLYEEIGKEVYRLYKDSGITKVLTIEASGIGLACSVAREFKVPALFAKKNRTKNIDGEVYAAAVESYTQGVTYTIIVSKKFLNPDDRVLIIDDFLARGNAMLGLVEIVEQSGASLAGCAIAIEKGFEDGGATLRGKGIRVESLAIIESMEEGNIVFREQ